MRRYIGLVVAAALLVVEASATVNFVTDVETYEGDHGKADAKHHEDTRRQLRAATQTTMVSPKVGERDVVLDADIPSRNQASAHTKPNRKLPVRRSTFGKQLQGQETDKVTEGGVEIESVGQSEGEFVRWNQNDCHPCEVPTLPLTLAPVYPHDYEEILPVVTEVYTPWEDLQASVETYPSTYSDEHQEKKEEKDKEKIGLYCTKITDEDGDWYDCDQESEEFRDATAEGDTSNQEAARPGGEAGAATDEGGTAEEPGAPEGDAGTATDEGETAEEPETPEGETTETKTDTGEDETSTTNVAQTGDPTPGPTQTSDPTPGPTQPGEPTSSPMQPTEPTSASTPGETSSTSTQPGELTTAPTKPDPTPATTTTTDSDISTGTNGEPTPEPTPASTTTTNSDTSSGGTTGGTITSGATTTGGTTTTGETTTSGGTMTTGGTATTDTTTTGGTTTGATTGDTTTTNTGTSDTAVPDNTANTSGTSTSVTDTTTTSGGRSALGAGGIAGIIIGCGVFVAIVVGAVLFRQKSLARQREENLFADIGGGGLETDYAAM